jgi:hypothetical protein
MFIGGALSIDQAFRTEGYSWWRDEELSIKELDDLIGTFMEVKPRVMLTHDCPREVGEIICKAMTYGMSTKMESRTCQALQAMWSAHSPNLWVFGHWHYSFDHVLHGGRMKGTRFVCLNELEYRDDLI